MTILRRYIRAEVIRYAALGLLLFTFVIFMQDLGRALEASVRTGPASFAELLILVLPAALVFTLPMALLVGLLIGLGRLGVDNEIIALRASGVNGRRLVGPLLQLAAVTFALALLLTLWLAPLALRRLDRLTNSLASTQLDSVIQPRVFFEPVHNPNWVLYVGGLAPQRGGNASGGEWRQVLAANMTNPSAPELTLAAEGQLAARSSGPGPPAMQLHLTDGTLYQSSLDHPETSTISSFHSTDIPFLLPASSVRDTSVASMSLGLLWQSSGFARGAPSNDWRVARVEFYRRFALAFACLALALLGIPLGLRGGRGGKSGGFVLALILVFSYYLVLVLGLGLARQGKVPPFLGAWAANFIALGLGLWSFSCLDRIPSRPIAGTDPVAWVRAFLSRRLAARYPGAGGLDGAPLHARPLLRRSWMPRLIEGYVIREFLGYTGLLLASFLVIVLVFTLFELIGSILQNHISATMVAEYLLYFSPQTFYLMVPVAILVGVLITFGLMSKANEITALKASGVSAYHLLVPVLMAAALLCGLQFALDATWLPGFNQKQDALRAEIKGQPPQTYTNPEREWVFGRNHDIYYFTFFDPGAAEFADLTVFQFDPNRFQLTRRIFARDARWDPSIHGWVFTNGWVRSFDGGQAARFQRFQLASFDSLTETPAYFSTDTRQGSQMSFRELQRYIATLRANGYDVARLSVSLWNKLAYPLTTIIMALLAFPFALTVGRRSTVAGLTVGILVAIAYWTSSSLLQALGNLNQLPAAVAAWTPDALFLAAGLYLLLRIPT